jgi:ribonuclease P protein component
VATKFMTVLAQPSHAPCDRLGIIASRRLGGAVVRNRAKRRLRAIFRLQHAETPLPAGVHPLDLVVIPRRELASAPFLAITADFQSAVRRLRSKS